MTNTAKRNWFRIHLSTAIAMLLVIGCATWINSRLVEQDIKLGGMCDVWEDYHCCRVGWPFVCYAVAWPKKESTERTPSLLSLLRMEPNEMHLIKESSSKALVY